MTQHLIYSREAAFGTWVTPATWLPVDEANVQSQREQVELRLTGSGRDLRQSVLGAKPVNGPLVLPWHFTGIGGILASFLRSVTTVEVVASTVYTHSLLFDDTVGLLPLSMQQQYSASVALNILSAVVTSMTISAVAKEKVGLNFALEAKDEALAGGTWDYDGVTSSPAVISSPSYPSVTRPFMFYDGTVQIGGTASISSNIISLSGATAYPKTNNFEVGLDLGVDTDGFGITTDPTQQELWPGDREITVSIERSWTDLSTTLYAAWRAGTPQPMELKFVGPEIDTGHNYEAHIVMPAVVLNPAQLPGVTGSHAKKRQSVSGKATEDATTGHALNIWIKTSEATL